MNCTINERTGDGQLVGRCWFQLVKFVCPRHGNVMDEWYHFQNTGELTKELPRHRPIKETP